MEPLILGIESSCDETAVALVTREGRVRVNAVASQVAQHAVFGGVVPEVAARMHIQACLPMVRETLRARGIGMEQIDAVAATRGPGLIGCLLVGLETAKTLAWVNAKPFVAVNHLAGHLFAIQLQPPRGTHLLMQNGQTHFALPLAPDSEEEPNVPAADLILGSVPYPHVGLIVSGGHTSLVLVNAPGAYETIAQTRDDAAGEAYDKFARVAGLPYPGGPHVDRLAAEGNPATFGTAIQPPMLRKDKPDFSFSGLKTQAGREAERLLAEHNGPIPDGVMRDLCAAFQFAAVESLLVKTLAAADLAGVRDIVVTGGVACNRGLRRRAAELTAGRRALRIWFPHPSLCTDNAAMIAGLAWHLPALAPAEALACNAAATLAVEAR